jgi:serine/threonine-protein kinase
MPHPLLSLSKIDQGPGNFLNAAGKVFAIFDERSQDSGNISYGVEIDGERFFVKTAGSPGTHHRCLPHADRVALLRNAAQLARECDHPALPPLRHVIENSLHGAFLVYDWVDGELIGVPKERRDDPKSSYQRFLHLPTEEIIQALGTLYETHAALAALGWVAVDFYDGSMIYDFEKRRLWLVDLDMYHKGSFTNEMGEMFGSSRFMAPEEHTSGAVIDERTTVFTMGRAAAVFLSDGTLDRKPFRGPDALYEVVLHACRENRADRFCFMSEFYSTWNKIVSDLT